MEGMKAALPLRLTLFAFLAPQEDTLIFSWGVSPRTLLGF